MDLIVRMFQFGPVEGLIYNKQYQSFPSVNNKAS